MHSISTVCTKIQMRLCKLTTPDTHHTSNLLTQNWTLMTNSRGCIAFTTHHHSMANLVTSQFQNEVEINEAHVRNPNYKGKNYDPNYQQNRSKQYPTTNTPGCNYKNGDSQNNTYKPSPEGNNYNSHANNYQKNTLQDKPANVSVTLSGPVTKEQLYKIQEVLRHLSQYRDKIRPEDQPATGEYAKTSTNSDPRRLR